MSRKNSLLSAIVIAVAGVSAAAAQNDQMESPVDVSGLKEAITEGVLTSPRVNADWYNFAASGDAERSARGGYYPSVDLAATIGREDRETPLVDLGDYGHDATNFSITQMLFDGFATRDEVARLGYAKLSQYYIFKRSSEEVAFEVALAFLDTVKYQHLVKYAADNLNVHRQIHAKIAERAQGGVSEGVDLDQAVARVGLAETNLVTEVANLNDVMVRFQRLVGTMPPENLTTPTVPSGQIPKLRGAALDIAYQRSPVINAAIENLRSKQEALNLTNAPMMPRFDLRYRNEVEHDTDGFDGRFNEEAIEVVMTYNLYRGGSDSARKRERYNLYYAAIEERKQACLNVRQEVMDDFNNVAALQEQVVLTEVSRLAQDKTRRAYRDQFDLGQRSLLDLLDSQNEYFDSERSHISAVLDLVTAQASTLANMGLLLAALEIDGLNAANLAEMDLNLSRDANDENSHALCPGDPETAPTITAASALAGLSAGSDRYRKLGGDMVALEVNVQFGFDSAVITSAFDGEIGVSATTMRENPNVRAVVEGHTDTTGDANYNQQLSERRAEAVRNLLINEYSVDPSQVTAVGRGESMPVSSNDSVQGRRDNRRVELLLDIAK